ncbi:hypothetical protein XM47_17155 [Catenovulum maritimum]|uniref:Cxxc_20_cxxc protein n=1 Tax=Catenovulum maritimum TaxID=1513271 RepID=A0A0J8GM29_9ALTE|nr:hypothetical protein XM47_17155 [Catenovulum maritimum]
MKCPECQSNGVGLISKLFLLFEIELRCSCCGSVFVLSKGVFLFINLALQSVIYFSIIYSFIYLSVDIVYLGLLVGILCLAVLVLFLPMRLQSKIGSRRLI